MPIVTKPKIPLEPVTSSNIAALGYDPVREQMAVQFVSGHVVHYSQVSLEEATAFYVAESKGKHYAAHVRGKKPAEYMTGPCPKCGDDGWIGETCTDCGTDHYHPKPAKWNPSE